MLEFIDIHLPVYYFFISDLGILNLHVFNPKLYENVIRFMILCLKLEFFVLK
jgi:hypothetical protein